MSSASGSSQTFCVIRSGGALYGLPALSICEVVDWQTPSPVPLAPRQVAGVVAYQGDMLTVLCLGSLLGDNVSRSGSALLVVEDPVTAERFALAVDAVEQIISIAYADIKPNPPTLSPRFLTMFAGICRRSPELLILLNLSSLTPDSLLEEPCSPEKAPEKGKKCER